VKTCNDDEEAVVFRDHSRDAIISRYDFTILVVNKQFEMVIGTVFKILDLF
jgi:hypothetical protein